MSGSTNLLKSDYEQYTKLIGSTISKEMFDDFIDNVLGEDHRIIVMRGNGTLTGTGTLFVERKLTHGGCVMGHIENVLVGTGYRNEGRGKRIVNELLETARARGCYRVDLSCASELESFYQECGMTRRSLCMSVIFEGNLKR